MHTPAPWFFDITPEQSDYSTARSVVFGIPYGGAGFERCAQAPRAVFEASPQVESFDESLAWFVGESGLATVGREALEQPLGSLADAEALLDRLLPPLLADGKFPVMVGGSPALVCPAVSRHLARTPELGLVRFDARAAVATQALGLPLGHVTAVGVRRVSRDEWSAMQGTSRLRTVWGGTRTPADWVRALREAAAALPRQVYVSLDASVLDPALMPATVGAEPGGLSWQQLCGALEELFETREVVGLDVTGLTPIQGLHSADFLVAKLVYRAIGLKQRALVTL